jgi:hypothetical protein
MKQVSDEEARPRITRSRIRSQEDIVRIDGDVALDSKLAKQYVADARKMSQSPFQHFFASVLPGHHRSHREHKV